MRSRPKAILCAALRHHPPNRISCRVLSVLEAAALITAATLRCLSRQPTPQEIEIGRKFLQKQTYLTPGFRETLADYCLALLNSNEFVYLD
jgi:hypothetical protein